MSPAIMSWIIKTITMLMIFTESQEDDLGVDHEDVEGGGLPGVPEHVDQVLALRPVKVTVLLPHLITTNKR